MQDYGLLLPPPFLPQALLYWEGLSLPKIPPRTPDSCFLPHALHRLGFTGKASIYPRCLLAQTRTKKRVSSLVHRGWEPQGPPFHGGARSAVQVRVGLAGVASPSRCCCRRCGGCGTLCATGAMAAVGYMAAESRGHAEPQDQSRGLGWGRGEAGLGLPGLRIRPGTRGWGWAVASGVAGPGRIVRLRDRVEPVPRAGRKVGVRADGWRQGAEPGPRASFGWIEGL